MSTIGKARGVGFLALISLMGKHWPYRHFPEKLQTAFARELLANKEPQASFFGAVFFGAFALTVRLLSLLPYGFSGAAMGWAVVLLAFFVAILLRELFRSSAFRFKIVWPELWREYVVFTLVVALWSGLIAWTISLFPHLAWPDLDLTFLVSLTILVGESLVSFFYLVEFNSEHT